MAGLPGKKGGIAGSKIPNSGPSVIAVHSPDCLEGPNRFFGIPDLAYLKAGIRDFREKGGARFGIVNMNGIRDLAVLRCEIREMLL